jgi:hypothetical protein
MAARLSGIAVAYTAAGFVLLWSGIKNVAITTELKDFLKGQAPPAGPSEVPTIGVTTPSSTGSAATPGTAAYASQVESEAGGGTVSGATEKANQAVGEMLCAAQGWTGGQWTAFNWVVMAESGWDNLIKNPSSGAFGIAQALGHNGPQGKYSNNYGGSYTSASVALGANNGDATDQIEWMIAYIKAAYGNPEAAQAYHEAHDSY